MGAGGREVLEFKGLDQGWSPSTTFARDGPLLPRSNPSRDGRPSSIEAGGGGTTKTPSFATPPPSGTTVVHREGLESTLSDGATKRVFFRQREV